jgi:hypothetical protein
MMDVEFLIEMSTQLMMMFQLYLMLVVVMVQQQQMVKCLVSLYQFDFHYLILDWEQ